MYSVVTRVTCSPMSRIGLLLVQVFPMCVQRAMWGHCQRPQFPLANELARAFVSNIEPYSPVHLGTLPSGHLHT